MSLDRLDDVIIFKHPGTSVVFGYVYAIDTELWAGVVCGGEKIHFDSRRGAVKWVKDKKEGEL